MFHFRCMHELAVDQLRNRSDASVDRAGVRAADRRGVRQHNSLDLSRWPPGRALARGGWILHGARSARASDERRVAAQSRTALPPAATPVLGAVHVLHADPREYEFSMECARADWRSDPCRTCSWSRHRAHRSASALTPPPRQSEMARTHRQQKDDGQRDADKEQEKRTHIELSEPRSVYVSVRF